MPTPHTIGYLDRLSYVPGQRVVVHADGSGAVFSRLVRLGRGPVPGREASPVVAEIPWEGTGEHVVSPQRSAVGSFLLGTLPGAVSSAEGVLVGAWIWPTMPDADEEQTVAEISDGHGTRLVVTVQSGAVAAQLDVGGVVRARTRIPDAVRSRVWSFVAASLQGESLTLRVHSSNLLYAPDGSSESTAGAVSIASPTVTFAAREAFGVVEADGYARGHASAHFEGKIAHPVVLRGLEPLEFTRRVDLGALELAVRSRGGALWDLSPQRAGSTRYRVPVLAGVATPGILVNLPNQGVTGPNWDATSISFRQTPEQYAAAHFHSTDLVDVGWDPLFTADLPADLPSGVYGVELSSGEGATDTIPLFVTPAPGSARERITVVMPTFSYLAYGNEDLIGYFSQQATHVLHVPEVLEAARARQVSQSREWGLSLYDSHRDGSGIHYSSSLRPILDMRPDYRFWAYEQGARGFTADLYLIEWLEAQGLAYDVITDLELHVAGASGLAGTEVVLLGSHPEYHSGPLLDTLETFRDNGGKIGYLGGNGLYWVTGLVNTSAQIVEIRRGLIGIRTWESEPGEAEIVSSWELGGLWRSRGRAPQRLVGIGMAAQGGASRPFVIAPDARERAPWFFEGVHGDTIGERGFVGGAAAGDEMDRVDSRLGTPPGTIVLASSNDHSDDAQRAIEEVQMTFHGSTSGSNDPDVRADMIYFDVPGGGAVFSTGAIAYIASLLVDAGDNTSSRTLRNVIDHFLGEQP